MKYPTLLALILVLANASIALGQEAAAAKATPENSFANVVDEKALGSILERSDKAKEAFENCQQDPNGLLECLKDKWKSFDDGTKEEITNALQSVTVTFENGEQVFKETKATGLKLNPNSAKISTATDPAVQKFRDYLTKQLSDALYGEMNKTDNQMTKRKLVDHSTFYELFESQVGQNIILALSDYCLSSKEVMAKAPAGMDPDGSDEMDFGNGLQSVGYIMIPVIEEDSTKRQKQESDNLKDLKDSFTGEGDASDKSSPIGQAGAKYNKCISRINLVCNPLPEWTDEYKRKDLTGNIVTQAAPVTPAKKNSACLVSEYIDRGRQALIDLDKIKKTMKENQVRIGSVTDNPEDQYYQKGRGKDEKSIQELTVHTSKEIESSGMKEVNAKTVEKIDECINSGGGEEECKNFVDDKLEENQKVLADEFFRAKAQENRLEVKLKEDENAVLSYLKEEGYDDASAQAVIDEAGGNEEAIKKIKERFASQKDAVIDALNNEIKDSISAENASADDRKGKAETLKSTIEARPDKLASLLQFSNLASSFIRIEKSSADGSEKSISSNSLAAFSELSGFESNDRAPTQTGDGEDKTALFGSQEEYDKAIEKLGEPKNSEEEDNTKLTVEQINSNLINY